MKTRARDRENQQNLPPSAVSPTTSTGGVPLPSARLERNSGSSVNPAPLNITSTISDVADRKGHHSITSTRPAVTGTSETQTVTETYSRSSSGGGLSERRLPSQKDPESTSPVNPAVRAHVQDVQYSVPDRHASPIQLTELASTAMPKTGSPPSDKNHNVPSMYVTSTGSSLPCSTSGHHCQGQQPQPKLVDYSGLPLAGSTGFAACYYYHDLSPDKKVDSCSASHCSVSPVCCVYPKDSLYPPQYTLDNPGCKLLTLCSMDTGREYSPPEMSAYSGGSSTAYTSPMASSVASSGSPDSLHWNSDSAHVLQSDSHLSQNASTQPTPPLLEAIPDTEKSASDLQRSMYSTYYSDEHSLEEDAMREIKQDILMSDIHKHIYQNVSQHLSFSLLDEESQDHVESRTPGRGGAAGRSGTTSKKRRRRTQTPVQRKAANMRERKRMCHLNSAFNCLKDRLPNVRSRKKLSRIQTLKAAIFYIGLLSECLQSA